MTLLVGSIFHMTRKIVSEMTYNVLMGTLNPTIPYQTCGPSRDRCPCSKLIIIPVFSWFPSANYVPSVRHSGMFIMQFLPFVISTYLAIRVIVYIILIYIINIVVLCWLYIVTVMLRIRCDVSSIAI